MTHLAAFLAVSALVIVTPGQDTALTIRNALLGGRRGGVFTAGGVAVGHAPTRFEGDHLVDTELRERLAEVLGAPVSETGPQGASRVAA